LILGNNNAIIFNSKYYKAVLFLGLFLAFLAISLNSIFIPLYGINGAAIATLISITFYSLAKLMFVVFKMKLYPFTKNTLVSFVISSIIFLAFYFWDFPFHPITNIVLKSILLTLVYVFVNYKLRLSLEINHTFDSVLKRISFK
jgi:O-antigen/teichoic acid export membrane protein